MAIGPAESMAGENITHLNAAKGDIPSPREPEVSKTLTVVASILGSGMNPTQKLEALVSILGSVAQTAGTGGPSGSGTPPHAHHRPWITWVGGVLLALSLLGDVGDVQGLVSPAPSPAPDPTLQALDSMGKSIDGLGTSVGQLREQLEADRIDQREWNALVAESISDVAQQTPESVPDSVGYLKRLQAAQEKKQ